MKWEVGLGKWDIGRALARALARDLHVHLVEENYMRTKHAFHLCFSKYFPAAGHIVTSQRIILVALG